VERLGKEGNEEMAGDEFELNPECCRVGPPFSARQAPNISSGPARCPGSSVAGLPVLRLSRCGR
jgi:hypothetical protein